MNIKIERAKDEDWPAILRVLETANMHHIPSKEMPELDISKCFVAKDGDKLVGVGGYKMLPDGRGKTTVLVVDPDYRGHGIGHMLQVRRVEEMEAAGATRIITNADRPDSIAWYKKHFCYSEVGVLKKFHEFGLKDVDHWTTLEMDVPKWRKKHGT